VTNQTYQPHQIRRNQRWLRSSPPPVIQSSRPWEFGLAFHPWLRLDNAALGYELPMIMFDMAELRANGYTPQALGLEAIGARGDPFAAPVVPVVVELQSRYHIDLYEAEPVTLTNPVYMLGGVFEDPHPDAWWDQVNRDGQLLLVAGDTPALAAAAQRDTLIDVEHLMLSSFVGRAAGIDIGRD
jgi:hypothetical protein